MKIPSLIFFIISIVACTTNTTEDRNNIGFIDNEAITYDNIDNTIKQELFDALNNIYIMRKIAFDSYVNKRILSIEANKFDISIDSLLNRLYHEKIDSISLMNFATKNNIDQKLFDIKRGELSFYETRTKYGQELLLEKYKSFITVNFVDSLKKHHNVKFKLNSPNSPKITLNNLLVHYKGNLDSKISFVIISDFECDLCKEYQSIFDSIYTKYNSKIKFGFTNYGSYATPSAIASECASKQGKFWEFHNEVMKSSKAYLDTTDLFNIAELINLNIVQFKKEFFSNEIKTEIENNLNKIRTAGIYGTPTILINDKIIFKSSSVNEIIEKLENEIDYRS